jgi:hypothetical protein
LVKGSEEPPRWLFEEKHFQKQAKLNAENATGGALALATLRACREIVKSLSL